MFCFKSFSIKGRACFHPNSKLLLSLMRWNTRSIYFCQIRTLCDPRVKWFARPCAWLTFNAWHDYKIRIFRDLIFSLFIRLQHNFVQQDQHFVPHVNQNWQIWGALRSSLIKSKPQNLSLEESVSQKSVWKRFGSSLRTGMCGWEQISLESHLRMLQRYDSSWGWG